MTEQTMVALEGGEAVASVAFRTNEVIAIYPITPSSTMGEYSADWESQSRKNIWGDTPSVVEMQSEGGAAARWRRGPCPPPSPPPKAYC